MYGYQMVLLWITICIIIFFPIFKHLNILYRTIGYWCVIMLFIAVFEFMLPFNFDMMCGKGKYYYKNKLCYWSEPGKKISDMFSSKMYMELYSDYSLADCKYKKKLGHDGFHFVMFGELWHGFFSGIFSITSLYYLFKDKTSQILLSIFTLGIIQLVMITWYVSPVILELFIEKSGNHYSKWWWPPFLWNLPWFIVPPLMIYEGYKGLV